MSSIKRGDVFYVDLNPAIGSEQGGNRPVVVLQNNIGNKYSPTITVVPLTTRIKKEELPLHHLLRRSDYKFLTCDNLCLAEQIRNIDRSRVLRYIGSLKKFDIDEIVNKAILNISEINFKTKG